MGFCFRGSLGAPPAVARYVWRLMGCAWDEEQAGMPMSQGGVGIGRRELADFDQTVTLGDEGFNLGEERLEPCKQGATTGVADAQPNDDRIGRALAHAVWGILVLGKDDGLMCEGIIPDGGIIGMPQTNIGNMLGGVAMPGQKQRESRGQLGVDEETHEDQLDTRSTGWSAWAAA